MTDTDWGTMYAAYRPAEAGKTYWRFAHFLFPFWTQTPQGAFDRRQQPRLGSDGRQAYDVLSLTWKKLPGRAGRDSAGPAGFPGSKLTMDFQPNTTDWYGRWRLAGRRRQ